MEKSLIRKMAQGPRDKMLIQSILLVTLLAFAHNEYASRVQVTLRTSHAMVSVFGGSQINGSQISESWRFSILDFKCTFPEGSSITLS